MAVSAIKAASRTVLRRSHFPNRQSTLMKQHHSTTPRAKTQDDSSSGTSIPVPNTVATIPLWQRLGPLSRGFQAYGRSQRKRPYATQFCSSLVIYILGDLSAQNINGDEYDPARTLRALIISAGSSIPSYKWYGMFALSSSYLAHFSRRFMFLGNNFNYSSKLLSLTTKVTVNQICFTPIFNSYFFGMQSLLSGDALPDVWERIKRTVPTSMINSCKLWPAVTAFSFTFIDAQYRAIFAGFVAIGWQTYLSYLNRKAEVEEAAQRAIVGDGGPKIEKQSSARDTQKVEA